MVVVIVGSWLMYNVYESPHKDRKKRKCMQLKSLCKVICIYVLISRLIINQWRVSLIFNIKVIC